MHTWACLSAWIADVNKGFNCVVIFSSECCVVCFRQRDLLNGTRRQKSSLFERRAEEESVVPSACLPPAGGLVRGVPKNTFVVKIFRPHAHALRALIVALYH